MEKFHVDCYGEALVDLIVQPFTDAAMNTQAQPCLGGSVFNFCVAAQRQGMATRYLNALSHDMFGQQFAALLHREGASCAHAPEHAWPTSIAVVQLSNSGQASYAFHRQAVADIALNATQIIASFSAQQQLLHTGCLMLVPGEWLRTQQILKTARERGALLSVDANMRLSVCPDVATYRLGVLEACALADIVKVSDDDLVALGLMHSEQANNIDSLLATARHLLSKKAHTQLLALTLGERGAYLLTRENQVFCPVPSGLKVQDTVGAGDSFIAALLASLAHQGVLTTSAMSSLTVASLQLSLQHAITAAALCVQRVGCDPATWEQTQAAALVT